MNKILENISKKNNFNNFQKIKNKKEYLWKYHQKYMHGYQV